MCRAGKGHYLSQQVHNYHEYIHAAARLSNHPADRLVFLSAFTVPGDYPLVLCVLMNSSKKKETSKQPNIYFKY